MSTTQATERRESAPMCCTSTVALVQRVRRDLTCPGCGEHYWFAPETALPHEREALVPPAPDVDHAAASRPSMPTAVMEALDCHTRPTVPGARRDRRISVVHDPSPSEAPLPNAKARSVLPDEDSGEPLVTAGRTAALLDELQVDLRRPRQSVVDLDLGLNNGPMSSSGADWSQERVQVSRRWERTSLASPVPRGEDVRDTIVARTVGHDEAYATLMWLRCESGVTGDQLRARGGEAVLRELQGALGYRFAPAEIRARFDASKEALEQGAPIRGRWRLEAAMKAWWLA